MSALRVLVTRPETDAARTAERLRLLGHDPLVAPLTRIVRTAEPPPAGRFDALILTSANAAAALGAILKPLPPVFAVGARTADAARAHGVRDVHAAEGDALALAGLIEAALPPGARLLHVAGRDRKAEPAVSLAAAGFSVAAWTAYAAEAETVLPPLLREALTAGALDAALHFSRRGAALLTALVAQAGVEDALAAVGHACLSQDVAEPLRAGGFRRIAVANRPDEDALLVALAGLRVTS